MGVLIKAKAQQITLLYTIHDPAIVQSESDIVKYVETHDVKYLVFEDVDEDQGILPATEFWVKTPSWEEAEPVYWEVMGNPRMMAAEMFRIYVDDFKYFALENTEGEQIELLCRKQLVPDKGMAIMPQIMSMIPKQLQQDIGTGIMTLGGITEKMTSVIEELQNELKKQLQIIPKEHEKNSSAPASSAGSMTSTSDAGAVNNGLTSEIA